MEAPWGLLFALVGQKNLTPGHPQGFILTFFFFFSGLNT